MKKQINVFYPISFTMVVIGILMVAEIFGLNSAQMNSINIGAALLTVSSAMVGTVIYKKTGILLGIVSFVLLILGIVLVFFGFLMPGFKNNFFLVSFLAGFDTNPLVLICLGITIASIVQFENHLNNSLIENERELRKRIETLENEKVELEKGIIKATTFIESIRRKDID
ncbi:hypothetical protein [Paenibacillus sp. FSL K6-1318]|uniref:hypothetical protein n=1 Tax=Paenibacillus sp. FSL K6-1318 TaxID=2975291 RepID=UPI0030EF0CF8